MGKCNRAIIQLFTSPINGLTIVPFFPPNYYDDGFSLLYAIFGLCLFPGNCSCHWGAKQKYTIHCIVPALDEGRTKTRAHTYPVLTDVTSSSSFGPQIDCCVSENDQLPLRVIISQVTNQFTFSETEKNERVSSQSKNKKRRTTCAVALKFNPS